MAAFLVLYHSATPCLSKTDQMDNEAEISRWIREISNSVIDGGSQMVDGVKVTLEDAEPLSEKSRVNNYLILEAQDKAEALELSRSAPTLYEGGSAEVYEIG